MNSNTLLSVSTNGTWYDIWAKISIIIIIRIGIFIAFGYK